MSQIAINTSQNVNIDFRTASVGERMLAFFIDLLIKGAYILTIYIVLFKYLNLGRFLNNFDQWSAMAIISIITLPIHIYTLVCESLMEGQTFGKKIVKIKVVKIDGYQAGIMDYLMRWVFRLIDVYSNSGIVGITAIIISKNNQRLGDMATGTAVISLKNDINISHTILENLSTNYVPTYPQVIAFSDNDMRIIKENYQKAMKLNDKIVIQKLATKIQETLKLTDAELKPTNQQLIATIIKDYNYYTGKDN